MILDQCPVSAVHSLKTMFTRMLLKEKDYMKVQLSSYSCCSTVNMISKDEVILHASALIVSSGTVARRP